ncbi:MAG: extracellular solute-binding protein [Thermoanaerobaculaceae bacterium]
MRPLSALVRLFYRSPEELSRLPLVFLLSLSVSCQVPTADVKLTVVTALPPSVAITLYRQISPLAQKLAKVNVEIIPLPEFTLKETIMATAAVGAWPWDLAIVPSSWLRVLARQQVILEVPGHHVQQMEEATALPALLGMQVDGRTMAYPIAADVVALIFNASLVPKEPSCLAELGHLSLPPGTMPLALNLTEYSLALPLLASAVGATTTLEESKLSEALAALRQQLSPALGHGETWKLCLEPQAEAVFAQLFAEQRLAAFVGSPKVLGVLAASKVPFRVVPVPPPCPNCPAPRPWASFLTAVVNVACPYPDLAQRVGLELAIHQENLAMNLAMRTLPVLAGDESAKLLGDFPELFGFYRALAAAQLTPGLKEELEYEKRWAKELGEILLSLPTTNSRTSNALRKR